MAKNRVAKLFRHGRNQAIRLPQEFRFAEIAGAIRADLETMGKPIGAYDLLMAGQTVRNKLTLIPANVSEFARIKALVWAAWGKP
jgi:predicted nucleic acid-binding protein